MSRRRKRPTEVKTRLFDTEDDEAETGDAHTAVRPSADQATRVERPRGGVSEVPPVAKVAKPPPIPKRPAKAVEVKADAPAIHVISMKTAADRAAKPAKPRPEVWPAPVAARRSKPTTDLGRLAPPRDRREVRARHLRDYIVWACAALMLACAVTLVIWFVSGR